MHSKHLLGSDVKNTPIPGSSCRRNRARADGSARRRLPSRAAGSSTPVNLVPRPWAQDSRSGWAVSDATCMGGQGVGEVQVCLSYQRGSPLQKPA